MHLSSPGGLSYSSLKNDPAPSAVHVQLVQPQDYSVNDLLQNISESRSLNIPQIMRAGELKPAEPQLPVVPISVLKRVQTSTPLHPEEEVKVEAPKYKGEGVVLIHRDYLDMDEPTQQSAWSHVPVVTVVNAKVDEGVQVRIADQERDSEAQSERGEVEVVEEREAEERREKEEEAKQEEVNDTNMDMHSERQMRANANQPSQSNQKPPAKESKKGKKRKAVNPKDNIVVLDTHISADDAKPVAPTLETVSLIPVHTEDEYVDVSAQMIDDMNTGRFEPATVNKNVFVTHIQ